MTSDPIGLAAGLNTYVYVRNMPTMLTDFFGLNDSKMPLNLGEGYKGRVDQFNYGGKTGFEIHVYDAKGKEVGVFGDKGQWINKHGHNGIPDLPNNVNNTLKGLTIEKLRGMGMFPAKGTANIKGNKWKNFIKGASKVCKVAGPVSIPLSWSIAKYYDEPYGLEDAVCDAVWGCAEAY